MLGQSKLLSVVVSSLLGMSIALLTLEPNKVSTLPDANCDPSYPDVCIASLPPDLNCGDVPDNDIRVAGADPHGFDSEGDGFGCES